tara:strand:+ start:862 stop:1194 length:333 start_codon:yes stop_codon:yes gene_type:complete
MKIDTQGMSLPLDPNYKEKTSVEEQRAKIPPYEPKKLPLITDMLKKELKDLINEVLDEREYERKLNGPYDVMEELSDINISPADIDDAYAHHFNVGIDTSGMVTLDDLEL